MNATELPSEGKYLPDFTKEQENYWNHAIRMFGSVSLIPVAYSGRLSPNSRLRAENIGKVPSVYNSRGEIVGFMDWTKHRATEAEIRKWKQQGCNVGLILGRDRGDGLAYLGIDVDTSNSGYQDIVADGLGTQCNVLLPYRGRDNSERRAYIVLAPAVPKHVHKLPPENGKTAAIELLGTGQQIVVFGTHPSGGKYTWYPDPMIDVPCLPDPDSIPVLTAEQLKTFWNSLPGVLPVTDSFVSGTARQRDLSSIDPHATDEVADWLDENDFTLSVSSDGSRNLKPFRDESAYSNGCSETSIKYFPAGTGGFQQGHFKSMHASDSELTDTDWLEGYGYTDSMFEDLTVSGDNGQVSEYLEWPKFKRDKNDKIEATVTHVLMALRRPDLCGVQIRLDEFRDEIILTTPKGKNLQLRDEYYTLLHSRLEGLGFKKFEEAAVKRAVRLVAYENRFDSLKDWVASLPAWDGIPRIDTFFCRHWGIEANAYTHAVGRYWWTLLAGRALVPGIKGDMAVILVSQQGKNKSEGIRAMAPTPEHYMELDFGKKGEERIREMRGHNVIELGEMRGMDKRGIGDVRVTISTRADRNRGLFREHYVTLPRRCGFIGTSNSDTPLTDTEGNRRWLPMTIPDETDGKFIAQGIADEKIQLWAEGVAVFKRDGIAWEKAETLAKSILGDYEVKDEVWMSCVAAWLEQSQDQYDMTADSTKKNYERVPLTSKDILVEAVGFKAPQVKRGDEMKVATIMKKLGYKKIRMQSLPGSPYHWVKM